jgi:hypothetical protein
LTVLNTKSDLLFSLSPDESIDSGIMLALGNSNREGACKRRGAPKVSGGKEGFAGYAMLFHRNIRRVYFDTTTARGRYNITTQHSLHPTVEPVALILTYIGLFEHMQELDLLSSIPT